MLYKELRRVNTMKMKHFIFLIFVSITVSAHAQNEPKSQEEKPSEQELFRSKIQTTLDEIKALESGNFTSKIMNLRQKVEKFLDYQKRICQGEFSTIVLNEFSNTKGDDQEVKKLDKEERKLCFRELKNIQLDFVKVTYEARIKFLKETQKKEMEALMSSKDEAIKNIQKTFSKF